MFFDYDPHTKTREDWFSDDGKDIIRSIQDVEDILVYNEHMAAGLDKKQDWWHVGSIPLSLCWEWARESGTRVFSKDWQVVAKRKLNDPDYAKFNVNRIKL